ncbi:MAG: peptidylprolyl isomerase [Pyrinomonadaceae bacterium]|nr:peptidylprolyl isomerase [Pyrinomonadaceae bacterium]
MSNLTKGLILLLVILGIGAGLVFWKNKVGGHSTTSFNSISEKEVGILIADVAKQNPMALKRLSEDAELRKQQLDNLKQLLAFASEAQREGLANEQPNKQELENIRAEVVAVSYDREINADKGPMPPFGMISEDQTKAFWGEGEQAPQGFFASLKDKIGLGKRNNELAFQKFIDSKVTLLKASNPAMKDREISEEEKTQARDFFARVSIYEQEYQDKVAAGQIAQDFQDRVNLQVKLQQAQFLARIFSEKLAEKTKVTDEDVAKYIAENPQFDTSAKKAKAEEILARAKGGEDFAKLANEFSEDPGNKGMGENAQPKGGLYENVRKGQMVKPFEDAALALEPGQVAPAIVESDYGYHIIKLEKKTPPAEGADPSTETYDVRHILISTGYKDPENPMGRETPVKVYVRNKLEEEREKKTIDEIVAKNNIQVPADFTVPEVTEEQIQDAMKKQRQQMGMDDMPGPQEAPQGAPDSNSKPASNSANTAAETKEAPTK